MSIWYQEFPFNLYYIKNLIFVCASLVMRHIIVSQDQKQQVSSLVLMKITSFTIQYKNVLSVGA